MLHNQPAPDGGTSDKWVLFGMLTPEDDQTSRIKMFRCSLFTKVRRPSDDLSDGFRPET